MHVHGTFWRSITNPIGVGFTTTFEAFAARCARPRIERDKMKLGGVALASFEGGRRAKDAFRSASAIACDFDDLARLEDLLDVAHGFLAVLYTTHSHSVAAPRARMFVFTTRPIESAVEYSIAWRWFAARALEAGLVVDAGAKDCARLSFVPGHAPGAPFFSSATRGAPIDLDAIVAEHDARERELARAPRPQLPPRPIAADRAERYARAALESAVRRVSEAARGTRNNVLNAEAFALAQLVAGGIIEDGFARDALYDAARAAGLGDSEIQKTLASAWRAGAKSPRVPDLRRSA